MLQSALHNKEIIKNPTEEAIRAHNKTSKRQLINLIKQM